MKKAEKKIATENDPVEKLSLIITILNSPLGETISYMLSKYKISAQFIQKGKGTATKDIYDFLGVRDNRKDIVYSVCRNDEVELIISDLNNYFNSSRKKPGIAFAIPFASVVGLTTYKFLSQI